MYLYFNENGVLKEIINDQALRKGNADANVIFAYFEGNPQITTLTFNITPNGATEPIILNQDINSPLSNQEIPYDSNRKLKYFKYYTPYKLYKCTLTAETLASAGAWVLTILAINGSAEQVAKGTYIGDVEDNNLQVDTTITYGEYKYMLGLVGSKVGVNELENYQELLIAGEHIYLHDNFIDVRNIEGTIESVDLTESDYEITQEQIDLLAQDKLNYIVYDNERYNYSNENVYVYVDSHIIKEIVIDETELTWSLVDYELTETTTQDIDIRSDISLGITTLVPQSTDARIIVEPKQLVITIRCVGTGNRVPTSTILSDYELPSAVASRITRLYQSRHIAYGLCTTQFGTDRFVDSVELLWADTLTQTNVDIVITNSHEVSLDAKNITFDLRIVLDF